jgi:hypothetical protein
MFLVRDARTVKGYRVAIISWFADKSACYCRRCRCFYRLSLYRCCIASYAIAMAFPFTSSSSSRTRSPFDIWFGIWFGIRLDSTNFRFYNCLIPASFHPFSLIRQEHPTKTSTSRILLFDTRRVRTRKRSNLEA